MSGTTALSRGMAMKSTSLVRRYVTNTLSQILVFYVLFLLLFLGGQLFSLDLVSESLSAIIVGFFLFAVAYTSLYRIAWNMMQEAQWGTMEQLYMSPLGFRRVMIVHTFVELAISFLFGAVVLVLMMVTTGQYLSVDLLTVVPLSLLTLASVLGIAFALSGVTVLYKRIDNLFQFVQLSLVGLVAVPIDLHPVVRLLPLSLGSHLLRLTMTTGTRLWELSTGDLLLVALKGAFYFALGLAVLEFATRQARRRGALGDY